MIVCWLTLQILAASPVVNTVFICEPPLSLADGAASLSGTDDFARPRTKSKVPIPPCHARRDLAPQIAKTPDRMLLLVAFPAVRSATAKLTEIAIVAKL